LEFLDTNTWSLIIFLINSLSLLSITLLFSRTSVKTILLTISLWLILQVVYIIYGYYSNQIGFTLMGVFNIIVSLVMTFAQFGQEEEEYEDS
jgi:hypothetical protein